MIGRSKHNKTLCYIENRKGPVNNHSHAVIHRYRPLEYRATTNTHSLRNSTGDYGRHNSASFEYRTFQPCQEEHRTKSKEQADDALTNFPKPSPFLGLPLEIRMIIHRLLLRRDEPIRTAWRLSLFPKIIRTCRQVATESHFVLYSESTFLMKIF
jgi:hypothetical protein